MKAEHRPCSLSGRAGLLWTFFALLALFAAAAAIAIWDSGNDVRSFSEPVTELTDGWTVTDSAGNRTALALPGQLEYGTDGIYTLELTLPACPDAISSPALAFYSNYTDVTILLDGEELLHYPAEKPLFTGATGNTWLFVRLPSGYAGRTLQIKLRCQLGGGISYLLRPPLVGAKATMLSDALKESLAGLITASFMIVLALVLAAIYLLYRRRLSLNRSVVFLALFAGAFGLYVFCESSYAKMCIANAHLLYFTTLALLAFMPLPLVGFFSCDVGKKYQAVCRTLAMLAFASFFGQILAHVTGLASLRVLLPLTHTVVVLAIGSLAFVLLRTDRTECPGARGKLLASLPMMAGGAADIALLAAGRPSFNNSLWFVVGVTLFILIQFIVFLDAYYTTYRQAVESEVLRDLAFSDTLTEIGNRNAYEQQLKALGEAPVPDGFCCVVADINDLKSINDRLGHQAGDAAIRTAGAMLKKRLPSGGNAYRTGGDEFVVLLTGTAAAEAEKLASSAAAEAAEKGRALGIPITLATGSGRYEEADGNIQDFIRRVDSLMYENKRRLKAAAPGEN